MQNTSPRPCFRAWYSLDGLNLCEDSKKNQKSFTRMSVKKFA